MKVISSAMEKTLDNGLFSVRNMLLGVTAVLTAGIVVLLILQMNRAMDQSSRANLSLQVNEVVNSIALTTLDISEERAWTQTAYGYEGTPPSSLTNPIRSMQSKNLTKAKALLDSIATIPTFDGKPALVETYTAALETYEGMHQTILADLSSDKDGRALSARKIASGLTDVIDGAADLRSGIEN